MRLLHPKQVFAFVGIFSLFFQLKAFGASAAPTPPNFNFGDTPSEEELKTWCSQLGAEIKKLNWRIEPCKDIQWKIGGRSVQGRPLLYAEFGDTQSQNTTLIFSTVHGDEVTPLFLGIQLIHWMKFNHKRFAPLHVVVAPLVNPDGFFANKRTRVNANGVDVNRNFATRDWNDQALKAWKAKFKSDPRRYPGPQANSEPETVFQQELILRIKPKKILSIHSPLNMLDFDGPDSSTHVLSLYKFPKDYVRECLKLRARLKAISSGFFPGSLGNYAGQERGIPTLTLELPTADSTRARAYWLKFKTGIRTMIEFNMPDYAVNQIKSTGS
jgi:protein MpaA